MNGNGQNGSDIPRQMLLLGGESPHTFTKLNNRPPVLLRDTQLKSDPEHSDVQFHSPLLIELYSDFRNLSLVPALKVVVGIL
jgi:hypothetical protein